MKQSKDVVIKLLEAGNANAGVLDWDGRRGVIAASPPGYKERELR